MAAIQVSDQVKAGTIRAVSTGLHNGVGMVTYHCWESEKLRTSQTCFALTNFLTKSLNEMIQHAGKFMNEVKLDPLNVVGKALLLVQINFGNVQIQVNTYPTKPNKISP